MLSMFLDHKFSDFKLLGLIEQAFKIPSILPNILQKDCASLHYHRKYYTPLIVVLTICLIFANLMVKKLHLHFLVNCIRKAERISK